MRKKLLASAAIVTVALSLVVYVWIAEYGGAQSEGDSDTPVDMTKFSTIVNGASGDDISVCVDVTDGVTEEEAELIVGTAFIEILGDTVLHRLDSLVFDNVQITADYTWGLDENDLGHVFGAIVDLAELQITVSHCF